jgi:hypothetical protein
MKTRKSLGALALASLLLVSAAPLYSQTAEPVRDLVAAGASWNQYTQPQVSGNLMYAHQVSGGTFSFSLVDITAKTVTDVGSDGKPVTRFATMTSVSTGLAQYLKSIGPARIYVVSTVGVSAGGESVGGTWTAGGAAVIPIGSKGWCLMPNLRVLKSTVSEFQGIFGIAIGWGSK